MNSPAQIRTGVKGSKETSIGSGFNQLIEEINWDNYKNWLFSNKEKSYAQKLLRNSQKFWNLGFTEKLVLMESNRNRIEILKAIANLTRYLDIQNNTFFHEDFTMWMKRKELHWSIKNSLDTYKLAKQLDVNKIVISISKLPLRYKIFGLFVLVSGLRTSEAMKAYRHHDSLCNNGIMELFWDRGTKKTNAVFCHPILHTKITGSISRKIYHHINKRDLGFELKDLRKINFTMVATKIDPLLAEFMQGRRGNVSQRHYFLPLMSNNKRKWIRMWEPIIKKLNPENS